MKVQCGDIIITSAITDCANAREVIRDEDDMVGLRFLTGSKLTFFKPINNINCLLLYRKGDEQLYRPSNKNYCIQNMATDMYLKV